jgi:hypothetical protein
MKCLDYGSINIELRDYVDCKICGLNGPKQQPLGGRHNHQSQDECIHSRAPFFLFRAYSCKRIRYGALLFICYAAPRKRDRRREEDLKRELPYLLNTGFNVFSDCPFICQLRPLTCDEGVTDSSGKMSIDSLFPDYTTRVGVEKTPMSYRFYRKSESNEGLFQFLQCNLDTIISATVGPDHPRKHPVTKQRIFQGLFEVFTVDIWRPPPANSYSHCPTVGFINGCIHWNHR